MFRVKCHSIKEKILPELDDEFAVDVSEFDTLEELKTDIKTRLKNEKKDRADKAFREAIMGQAVENMTVEVPPQMTEAVLDDMMQEFHYGISSQGMDPNQYLQMMGMTPQTFRENSRTAAETRLKTQLLLDAVAKAENLEATEAEIGEEYEKIQTQSGMTEEQVKERVPTENLVDDIKRKKAADLIQESAVVAKSAPKKAKKADEKPEETSAD